MSDTLQNIFRIQTYDCNHKTIIENNTLESTNLYLKTDVQYIKDSCDFLPTHDSGYHPAGTAKSFYA